MASGENYNYDQPDDKRKVDPVNAGYDQPSDPPAYTPSPYGNQRQGQYPMEQFPPGPQGHYPPPANNNNINVVMTQPQVETVVVNPRPKDFLGLSIFTTLCCSCPIGIAAIVFSCTSITSADNLNFDQARKEANIARILNIVGIVQGVILFILVISLFPAGVL